MTSFGRTLRLLRRRAGISQPVLAATVFVSQPTISRFESGDRMPDPALARLLDDAVGAGGALVGLLPADHDRAEFQARRPGLVDRETILAMESGLLRLRLLEDATSSADVTPMVAARAEMSVQTARDAPYALRAAAIGVAAMGVTYLGWCHVVAGRYEAAAQLLDRAVAYAYESQEPECLERTMSYRGVLELVWGSPAAAACMFAASRHDTRTHPVLRAYDTGQQARALAHAGEARAADRLLLEADRLAGAVDLADVPAGAYWYTPGWLALQRGVAMLAQGRPGPARREIEQGYAAMPVEHQQAHWARQWIEAVTADRAPSDLVLPAHRRGKDGAGAAAGAPGRGTATRAGGLSGGRTGPSRPRK
ncbi:helix-turn-helix domain-containing protein [Kitasatospora sp. NPDC094019]|uniref:helix-turn-helix domain-containing protein n=1 Tax=Kitasatospora sp. NPDC094019 TaxID=3364091 RepID=UPI0037F9D265